jgi:hypothetical protein
MSKHVDPIWETNEGLEIPLSDMYTEHIRSAQAKLQDWRKEELKLWYRRFQRRA